MKTITTIEQKESYKKFLEINSLYESLLNLENKELNGWLKRLEPLKIDLCDSIYWEALIDKINEVKNKINY